MVCRPCPERVLVAVWTQPDFHAFIGNLWDLMCRPCSGCIMAMAMFEMHLGRDRDATRFPGISRQFWGRIGAAAGIQPDF
ncbi:Hypothetical predicted protein [Olea europaea subsp. europaea]|uniref:Uncharacterized protein n=1 Tax=Olea europaea subsp. europaea TaxID=158383 RepID=A0A8S0PM62_OLEEU|nr:Hypothetical predicted protein [Olea europaea subsp. europaea]